jgi:hypothetical protein
MGYFEGLTSGSFKTTPDGRRLFFPWGVAGRGYSIASEEDYLRIRRRIKTYMAVSLALIVAANVVAGAVVCAAIAAALMTFYLGWMALLLPRLTFSGEKMSLEESMTSSAQAHGATVLRLMQIGALALAAAGILMLVTDSHHRLIGLFVTLFFGLCLAKFTRMLTLRQRTTGA